MNWESPNHSKRIRFWHCSNVGWILEENCCSWLYPHLYPCHGGWKHNPQTSVYMWFSQVDTDRICRNHVFSISPHCAPQVFGFAGKTWKRPCIFWGFTVVFSLLDNDMWFSMFQCSTPKHIWIRTHQSRQKTHKIGKWCSGPCPIGHAQTIALGLSSDTDEVLLVAWHI